MLDHARSTTQIGNTGSLEHRNLEISNDLNFGNRFLIATLLGGLVFLLKLESQGSTSKIPVCRKYRFVFPALSAQLADSCSKAKMSDLRWHCCI